MSQVIIQAGERLLNALSRHSNIVMEAYVKGVVDVKQHSPKVIEQLLQLGVLWRPDSDGELRLKGAVRSMLEGSLQDEKNRTINANIGAALASLKMLAEHYKESLHFGRYGEATAYMSELTEHVYQLAETLSSSVRIVFSRINNEFGYVSSVQAKIRENELAQGQVTELLAQLECFRFDELSEIAGSNRELRHLLVVTLQQRFSKAAQELSVAQARLLDLMGRFREFEGRTRLLKGFLLHLEQHPDYTPGDYIKLSNVPAMFRTADALIQPASINVHNVEQEDILQQLVASITIGRSKKHDQQATKANQNIEVVEQSTVQLEADPMHLAVNQFFYDVIDSGQPTSALDYYQEQDLTFDQEFWLYQVIGGYYALDENDKAFFAIETLGQPDKIFNGNYYINDVILGLR